MTTATTVDLRSRIAEAMIGTKSIRFGPRPIPENYRYLEEVVGQGVEAGMPITAMVSWGAQKGYGLIGDRGCDLLDLAALQRLGELQRRVRASHPPGLRIVLVWEDFTEMMVTGTHSRMYERSLRGLIDGMGMGGYVEVVPETSLIDDDLRPRLIARIGDNEEAIAGGRAREAGWRGEIDWGFYLARAAVEFRDQPAEVQRRKVCIYLATALSRHQEGYLPRSDVRISFCPYPKATPDVMRRGRLEYKVQESRTSHKTAAPWTCFGVTRRDGTWTYASAREILSGGYAETEVAMGGRAINAFINLKDDVLSGAT